MWGIFADKTSATTALAKIDANMGLPARPEYVTRTWASPMVTGDGKQAFVLPEDPACMSGVAGCTQMPTPTWPIAAMGQ